MGYLFNMYTAVLTMKQPNKIKDLLEYSSIIVKTSRDFEGTPWLEYDVQFRKDVALDTTRSWAAIDTSRWTLCFANANPQTGPSQFNNSNRYQPYPRQSMPLCRKYNNPRCHSDRCCFRHVCANCENPHHTDDQSTESC